MWTTGLTGAHYAFVDGHALVVTHVDYCWVWAVVPERGAMTTGNARTEDDAKRIALEQIGRR